MQELKFRKRRRKVPKQKKKKQQKVACFAIKAPKLRFQKEVSEEARGKRVLVGGWLLQIIVLCVIAFTLVWFFGQRVSNAGDSMNPVLKNGDIVLVDRLVYNASKAKRGDIIAFKPNGNENTHYSIKRIAALPGETIQIKEGSIYINGKLTTQHIYADDIKEPGIAAQPLVLGADEVFVIGDNHEGSDDSRMADIGNVKRSEIYGKVWFVASFGTDFGFVK